MTKLATSILAAFGIVSVWTGSRAGRQKDTLGFPQLTSLFSFGSSIPIEMGFWKEEGLEVEALPAPGAAAAIQLVVGGRATAAIANPSSEMIAVQKGSTVKFYYSAQRGDIFGIGLPEERPEHAGRFEGQDDRRHQLCERRHDLRQRPAESGRIDGKGLHAR